MAETILIVDDEDSVRRTLYEWLREADSECELLQAADAESALRLASQRSIDLAILDWNLGAGQNGLQLLEDLRVFSPEVVAILVTGYAHQATPLDALRMGVRDYLDKSRDLRRETLLAIVRRQLAQIRPAKRQREHLARVQQFRQALESLLPLIHTGAELASPVPQSEGLRQLLGLAQALFQTRHGVLIVRQLPITDNQPAAEANANVQGAGQPSHPPAPVYTVLNLDAQEIQGALSSFADTLAASALAMQEVCIVSDLREAESRFGVRLQDYERGYRNLIAIPVTRENGPAAVLELFDTPLADQPWSEPQRQAIKRFQELAGSVLSLIFAQRHLHAALLGALQAAMQSISLEHPAVSTLTTDWKTLLEQPGLLPQEPQELLQLAERLRVLTQKYGVPALRFCQQLLEQLEQFLQQLVEPHDST